MRFHQSEAITAVAAGAVAYGATRYGLLARVPGLDGLPPALILAAIGLLIAGLWTGEGASGDIVRGAGYGLVAAGAIAFASQG